MPGPAVADMTEWTRDPPVQLFERMLAHEVAPDALLTELKRGGSRAIVDDRPVNEFFFLRRFAR
jgi:hypothetical protein